MARIAVYGKGGIGKSTISANLSAMLAKRGHRVLQVGCDPKHDSTRLLLHGAQPVTALDYMRDTSPADYDVSQVLMRGYLGIGCVEAGGPKPGVGCAGRGIISTFELLGQFRLDERYDTTVYDVLGDVVCGGFAVPIRREYADTIVVVTSGEFMSIYAANNILRGIRNYDFGHPRVAGIIFNARSIGDDARIEAQRVQRFAEAVGLPIIASIPRTESFARAEGANMTVVEVGQDARLVELFEHLAAHLDDNPVLHEARPLEDDELERVVLGTAADHAPAAAGQRADAASGSGLPGRDGERADSPHVEAGVTDDVELVDKNRYLSKNVMRGESLHGCAFNGALCTSIQLSDAVVLAHAPKSCAYISLQTISSTGRRLFFERGALLPVPLAPNLACTEMSQPEIVFGGMEKLTDTIREIKRQGVAGACGQTRPRAIVVVSACPAGIIGDDIDRVASLSEPGLPVVPIKTDGNMTGDNAHVR